MGVHWGLGSLNSLGAIRGKTIQGTTLQEFLRGLFLQLTQWVVSGLNVFLVLPTETLETKTLDMLAFL